MPLARFNYYDVDTSTGVVNLVSKHESRISVSQLVLAALTVGRPNWSAVFAHGPSSILECTWRCAMVLSNVAIGRKSNGDEYLTASSAFKYLDPSEKGAATFFIGSAMTKIVADAFGIPTLYHLDTVKKYSAHLGPNVPTVSMVSGGKSRPDFIGPYTKNVYGVFESKGRSHFSDDTLRLSAKAQTERIDQINGNAPFCRVACITSFGPSILSVDVVDPERAGEDSFEVSTEGADMKEPYRLTQSFLRQAGSRIETVGSEEFVVGRLEEADVEFGLSKETLNVIEVGSDEEMQLEIIRRKKEEKLEYPSSIIRNLDRSDEEPFAIGRDGHFVRLGKTWSAMMERSEM